MITVVIPANDADSEASVTHLENATFFVELVLDDGQKLQTINYHDNKEKWFDTVTYIVVSDPTGDYSAYSDEGIKVLLCPPFASVNDIYESFLFRELQEIA